MPGDPPRAARRRARLGLAAGLCCLAVAACGSSKGTSTSDTASHARSAGDGMSAMQKTGAQSSSMAGMNMGAGTSVDGIKPIPTQTLGTAEWQGMKITARAMTAVPFVVDDGTHERMVKPPSHVSFHLMVLLDDAHSGYPIPYAGVWATVTRAGRVVYDERQWPMLSEYMGPHYGNNVELPGAGRYTVSLLVSPPVSARHVEYQHVWLAPHRVTMSFDWKPPA